MSFRILKLGGMALYSLCLMSGGMLLPYVFGILFWREPVTLTRVLGLAAVLAAVILANFNRQAVAKPTLPLCAAVFILNGLCSIFSKAHQINQTYAAVDSAGFVMYSGIVKALLCTPLLLFRKFRKNLPAASPVRIRRSLPVIVGASVIGGVSYLLQLNAAASLPATVLYPAVTGGSIVFSAVTGRLLFRERISARQLLCMLL